MIHPQDAEAFDLRVGMIAEAIDDASKEFLLWVDPDVVEDAAVEASVGREGDEAVVALSLQLDPPGVETVVHLEEAHRFPIGRDADAIGRSILARLIEIHAAAYAEGDLGENVRRLRERRAARGAIPFGDMLVAIGRGRGEPVGIHEFAAREGFA